MNAMPDAYIDAEWRDGDGIAIVFATSPAEAAMLLDLDPDGEPETFAPACGMHEMPLADVYAYLVMTGDLAWTDCLGCCGKVTADQHTDEKDATPEGHWRSQTTDEEAWECRPVRVDGLGLFCSEGCWQEYAEARRRNSCVV